MKKILIPITTFLIILILFILNSTNIFLFIKGYDTKTINVVKKQLNKDNIGYIIKNKKINNLKDLINTTDFNQNYLEDYVELINNLDNLSMNNIVYIVNNKQNISYNIINNIISSNDFQENYLIRYINYYQKYNNAEINNIITIVNNEIDNEDIDYSEKLVEFIKNPYFVKGNVKRYIDYYKSNNDTSIDIVISIVNAKADYEYYTNTAKADTSKNNLILVNKFYYLDKDYVPKDLVTIESKYGYNYQLNKEAYQNFKNMCESALKENLKLFATSPYRSYSTQELLYNRYVNEYSLEEANRFSAKPGYSEHQTGLAVDVVSGNNGTLDEFVHTMEYKWLQENAHKYGFILRYPEGKEQITGYMFESWHYRYVGVKVATEIKEKNITFDEYYEIYLK